jgi:hypothetical protein
MIAHNAGVLHAGVYFHLAQNFQQLITPLRLAGELHALYGIHLTVAYMLTTGHDAKSSHTKYSNDFELAVIAPGADAETFY